MSFFVSYAGNREDVLIRSFFPDIQRGFYVDIGANHPVQDSVTKIFYDAGWSGINVEPLQSVVALLNKYRRRDINECLGIAGKEGELVFREYVGAGRSTFSTELMRTLEADTEEPDVQTYTEYPVPVVRLETLLAKYAVEHIHFMKIDVEGFEHEVLASNDWDKYRPELLCIEANHVTHDWHGLLKGAGYRLVFFDGLNEYYLAHESLQRQKYFDYPRQMLSGSQIIKWTVEREFKQILSQQKRALQKTIRQQAKALAEANKRIAELEVPAAERLQP